MPRFTYTGSDDRYYPTLGVEVTPGVALDLAEAPTDGRWESEATPQDAAPLPLESPEPEADHEPTNL
jgi:hypothetical protein